MTPWGGAVNWNEAESWKRIFGPASGCASTLASIHRAENAAGAARRSGGERERAAAETGEPGGRGVDGDGVPSVMLGGQLNG